MSGAEVAYAAAGRHLPGLIDGAVDDLADHEPDLVARAAAVELLSSGVNRYALAWLAARAIVEAAQAQRELAWQTGRRQLTDEDRALCAEEAAAKRREDG